MTEVSDEEEERGGARGRGEAQDHEVEKAIDLARPRKSARKSAPAEPPPSLEPAPEPEAERSGTGASRRGASWFADVYNRRREGRGEEGTGPWVNYDPWNFVNSCEYNNVRGETKALYKFTAGSGIRRFMKIEVCTVKFYKHNNEVCAEQVPDCEVYKCVAWKEGAERDWEGDYDTWDEVFAEVEHKEAQEVYKHIGTGGIHR